MKRIQITRVVAFVLATLGLTWGTMWLTAIRSGSDAFRDPGLPPLGMLIPAFVALFIETLIYTFMLNYLVRPDDKLFSFGLGAYGLACLAVVVLFIWRDPAWRQPAAAEIQRGG